MWVEDLDGRLLSMCNSGACKYLDLNALLAPTGELDERFAMSGMAFTSQRLDMNNRRMALTPMLLTSVENR